MTALTILGSLLLSAATYAIVAGVVYQRLYPGPFVAPPEPPEYVPEWAAEAPEAWGSERITSMRYRLRYWSLLRHRYDVDHLRSVWERQDRVARRRARWWPFWLVRSGVVGAAAALVRVGRRL